MDYRRIQVGNTMTQHVLWSVSSLPFPRGMSLPSWLLLWQPRGKHISAKRLVIQWAIGPSEWLTMACLDQAAPAARPDFQSVPLARSFDNIWGSLIFKAAHLERETSKASRIICCIYMQTELIWIESTFDKYDEKAFNAMFDFVQTLALQKKPFWTVSHFPHFPSSIVLRE